MRKPLFFIFTIIVIFSSCISNRNTDDTIIVDSFHKNTAGLSHKSVCLDSAFNPHFIYYSNNKLLTLQPENTPYFQIWNLKTMKLKYAFGYAGNAPESINFPVFWDQLTENETSTLFNVYQINNLKLSTLEINNDSIFRIYKTINIPAEVSDNVNIIKLGKYIYGTGIEAFGNFFKYNIDNKNLNWNDFPFRLDEDTHSDTHNNSAQKLLNLGMIKSKPDQTIFAKSFMFQPVIDLYDSLGGRIHRIICNKLQNPKFDNDRNQFDKETKMYFLNLFLSNKYIYAIDINTSIENYSSDNINGFDLLIFNYDGKALEKITFNSKINNAGTFTIDEINRKIYFIDPSFEFNNLQVYEY